MKPVSLYNGKYVLFEDGRIVSYARKKPQELIGKTTKGGYRMVILYDEKSNRTYKNVHRLIAEAFIPNPHSLREVNHIDGNKLNNSVSNLEWVTTQQNVLHCRDNLKNRNHKITMDDAREIRRMYKDGASCAEIQNRFGIKKTQVGYIVQNKRWVE